MMSRLWSWLCSLFRVTVEELDADEDREMMIPKLPVE